MERPGCCRCDVEHGVCVVVGPEVGCEDEDTDLSAAKRPEAASSSCKAGSADV